MKSLISPQEIRNYEYPIAWQLDEEGVWQPELFTAEGCYRIAEVEPDELEFPVASPLFWVDCPEDCNPSTWYYKDGELAPLPTEALHPDTEIEPEDEDNNV